MIVESLSNGVVTIVVSGDEHIIEINDNAININIQGGGVESVTSSDNHIVVDNTDPLNPVLSFQLVDNENLLTDDELAKLQNIEAGAQVNVLEGVKVNGVDQAITNKVVDISVPTKTSDLSNDIGFITKNIYDVLDFYIDSSQLPLTANAGDYAYNIDTNDILIYTTDWLNVEPASMDKIYNNIATKKQYRWNGSLMVETTDIAGVAGALDDLHLLDFEHVNIPITLPFNGVVASKTTVIYKGILYTTLTSFFESETPETNPELFEKYILNSDERLTNSRTPTAHKSTHATGQSDAISPGDIGAEPANSNIQSHIGIVAGNPHGTTAANVGAEPTITPTADTTPVDTDYVITKRGTAWLKTLYSDWKIALNGLYVTLSQTTAQTIGSTTKRILKSWHTDIDATNVKVSKVIAGTTGASGWVLRNNADTSNIIQVDEANKYVGVNVIPLYPLHVSGLIVGSTEIYAMNGNTAVGNGRILVSLAGNATFGNTSTNAASSLGLLSKNIEFLRGLPTQDINTVAGKYFYQAASPTADTVNDTRFRNNAGVFIFEICDVANATKGAGTWRETYRFDTNGFQTAQYDDILPSDDWTNASGGAAPDTVSHTVGGVATNFKGFDGNVTEETMANHFEITHAIDIDSLNRATTPLLAEIHTHGMASTIAAGVVKIFYDLVYLPVNAAPIALGTYSNLITINANEQYYHKIGGVELTKPSSGYNIGDKILVRYRRTPTDAQDTYTNDWLFLQCALHMPLNSKGSRQRYVK